eukprot:PhM_4_TR14641/c0_g1_i1/m.47735
MSSRSLSNLAPLCAPPRRLVQDLMAVMRSCVPPSGRGGLALDVGSSSDAPWYPLLAPSFQRVLAIGPDVATMQEMAMDRHKPTNVDVVAHDIFSDVLKLPSSSVDFVCMSGNSLLEDSKELSIREVSRVLRPHGVLCVTQECPIPSIASPDNLAEEWDALVMEIFGKAYRHPDHHSRNVNDTKQRRALALAGYESWSPRSGFRHTHHASYREIRGDVSVVELCNALRNTNEYETYMTPAADDDTPGCYREHGGVDHAVYAPFVSACPVYAFAHMCHRGLGRRVVDVEYVSHLVVCHNRREREAMGFLSSGGKDASPRSQLWREISRGLLSPPSSESK